MSKWWEYDQLPSGEPYDWSGANRGESPYDNIDFHLDIGVGKLRKGRLGIDRFPSEAVDLVMDLDLLFVPIEENEDEKLRELGMYVEGRMPFPDDSIKSIISHHCMEHIDTGFMRLMNECHRILEPGGILRIISPLFPSRTAVEDPDHKRYFMEGTFDAFCGTREGGSWLESFSVPYTDCRFEGVDKDVTPRLEDPAQWWGDNDAREIRVALRKWD